MFPLFLYHLIMDRSSRRLLLLLTLCIAPIIYFFSNGSWNSSGPRKSRGLPPANATLGVYLTFSTIACCTKLDMLSSHSVYSLEPSLLCLMPPLPAEEPSSSPPT